MAGCQCPKRLYLQKFKSEMADAADDQQVAVFKQGANIGILAQQLFSGGVNAQGDDEWHSSVTAKRTEKLLPVHNVIYEAAFMHDGVLNALDILVRKGKKYYAYEVKGSTKVKDYQITDAALQYYVMKKNGIEPADFFILHLNSNYVRVGDLNINELFTATSILDEIREQQPYVESQIIAFKQLLKNGIEPDVEMGRQCNIPYACQFQNYCSTKAPKDDESPVISKVNKTNFEKSEVKEFLKALQYPLYYMDFETVMYGVPEFDYSSPYQQIPFQYSLHIQQKLGGSTTHSYYLGNGRDDPRIEFIEQLITDLGKTGTILVWNITFEKLRLQEIATNFPKYAKKINAIIGRMVDLMVPFKKKYVMNEMFNGSASIKAVLPVLVPHLDYNNLAIQEGGTASFMYSQMSAMNAMQQAEVRSQLLEYCHLDTLAMVEILEVLTKHN
jgi:predicted RecB family nuclease